MLRKLTYFFILVSVAIAVPHYAERLAGGRGDPGEAPREETAAAPAARTTPDAVRAAAIGRERARSGTVALRPDAGGHFSGEFVVNGRRTHGMVDTGATFVAINRDTARRLGVSPANSDFVYKVRTANGETRAARAVLDRVEIGRIRVHDVEAFVLEDAALRDTLIGMSFLSKLSSYSVEDGIMLLEG